MTEKFRKIHLVIDRKNFEMRKAANDHDLCEWNLHIEQIEPTLDNYLPLLHKVGGPWGWDRRPKYSKLHLDEIVERLNDPVTQLLLLKKDDDVIGYCLVAPFKDELKYTFNTHARSRPVANDNVIEIENFGLLKEETKHGYGAAYLMAIFDRLFKDKQRSHVYLSTRTTNHPRVVAFYRAAGMHITGIEQQEDDLLPENSPEILPAGEANFWPAGAVA